MVVSIIFNQSYFCISKVSYCRETTEFRQSIVDTDFRILRYYPSGWQKSSCDIQFRRYSLSHSLPSSLSHHRGKQSFFVRLVFAPFLIPCFTLFSLLSNNVVVCKQECNSDEVLTGFQWLETKLFCLSLPRFSHLSYLLLLIQYKNQY